MSAEEAIVWALRMADLTGSVESIAEVVMAALDNQGYHIVSKEQA